MNTLQDLLTTIEFKAYQTLPYPFNIFILDAALKEKLKETPDYEVWVPLIYHKLESRVQFGSTVTPHKHLISNRGNVTSFRTGNGVGIEMTQRDDTYTTFSVNIGKKRDCLHLHRALGCVFLPLPDHLMGCHPRELHVNHKDGDKTNWVLDNLEWVTPSENALHASETGLIKTKPIKGVVLKGPHKGYTFLLKGHSEVFGYGFDVGHVSKAANGKINNHKNCAWAFASEKETLELPRGISKEIRDSLDKENSRIKGSIKGTHIETGRTILIQGGKKELSLLGFIPANVYTVLAGRVSQHKGYRFERIEETELI